MTDAAANIGRCHTCPWGNPQWSGDVPCGVSGHSQIAHAAAGVCPAGRFGVTTWPGQQVPPAVPAAGEPSSEVATFRRLWAAIYSRENPSPEWWAAEVVAKLPCGPCRAHTAAYMERHPPPWGDRDRFQTWARGLQDDVRRRQGR